MINFSCLVCLSAHTIHFGYWPTFFEINHRIWIYDQNKNSIPQIVQEKHQESPKTEHWNYLFSHRLNRHNKFYFRCAKRYANQSWSEYHTFWMPDSFTCPTHWGILKDTYLFGPSTPSLCEWTVIFAFHWSTRRPNNEHSRKKRKTINTL
jgi:hypothetical protein